MSKLILVEVDLRLIHDKVHIKKEAYPEILASSPTAAHYAEQEHWKEVKLYLELQRV